MIKYHFWTSEPRIPFSCWYWQSLQSCCPGNYQIVVWAFLCWQSVTNPPFLLLNFSSFACLILTFDNFSFLEAFLFWQFFLLSVINPPPLLLSLSSFYLSIISFSSFQLFWKPFLLAIVSAISDQPSFLPY